MAWDEMQLIFACMHGYEYEYVFVCARMSAAPSIYLLVHSLNDSFVK
jgi:hypothetical protein